MQTTIDVSKFNRGTLPVLHAAQNSALIVDIYGIADNISTLKLYTSYSDGTYVNDCTKSTEVDSHGNCIWTVTAIGTSFPATGDFVYELMGTDSDGNAINFGRGNLIISASYASSGGTTPPAVVSADITISASPTQRELTTAVKSIISAMGGTITSEEQ